MRRTLAFFLVLLGAAHAAPPATAAPAQDLGKGLAYRRVHALPADLPTDPALVQHPCVLDLRYVQADATAAAALEAWVKFHSSARAPVFLLANSATSPALLAPFAGRPPAGLLIVGAAAPDFSPDIAVKISAETERRAYDALERGTAVEQLLLDHPDKPRNDEARLAKDHVPDGTPLIAPAAEEPKPVTPPVPAPPVDAVLARAVHLHRTLIALKKI